ncbi:MAG TPA: hypothetical protein VGQ44_15480, partial [Gemmatimonadaceae bacterium]|nr:hypothetical protein [Gemmatimonadaceae bacterium]
PMPRVDTVTIYRTDTLQMPPRVDTVTTTNTVVRTDTLVQTITRPIPAIGSFYGGIAGGVTVPAGGLRDVNETGGTGQLQVGWQPVRSVLGARLDASYSRFRRPFEFGTFNVVNPLGTTITTFDDRNSNLWNFNLSLKVAIPGIETAFGRAVTFHPYLIGGGGFVTYDHLNQRTNHGFLIVNGQGVLQTEDGIILNDVTVENFDSGWHTDWGWNAGGGLAWRFANKELFVESRVMGFTRRNSDFPNISWSAARQVPIVFGMNFY